MRPLPDFIYINSVKSDSISNNFYKTYFAIENSAIRKKLRHTRCPFPDVVEIRDTRD